MAEITAKILVDPPLLAQIRDVPMVSPASLPVRRLFTVAVLGLALAGGATLTPAIFGSGHASVQTEPAYASVTVDTSPLGATLYKPTGVRLRDMMDAGMKRRFPVTGDMSKPRLVVRLTDIVVPPESNQDNSSGPAHVQSTDRMDGETLIVAPDGKVLHRFPVTVSAPSSLSGAPSAIYQAASGEDDLESDFRRLGALIDAYASWSARYAATP